MKSVFLFLLAVSFSKNAVASPTPFSFPSTLGSLSTECLRIEENYPDFACLRFEFYQSSAQTLDGDIAELVETNDYELRTSSWNQMMSMLMSSMDGQIYRYQDPRDIEILRRTKAKNQWELLKLKDGLRDFWVDPHTYWYPSVDAITFIAVNRETYQILVISHGERN
ncbi:hypothetical protein [Bdellovibrio bacteriovorus]|uniref:hypothetical protein n=1 Tax=Bdellovibrio TaxID=958 RepID=UPI0035A93628